jgi:hypothetical protein
MQSGRSERFLTGFQSAARGRPSRRLRLRLGQAVRPQSHGGLCCCCADGSRSCSQGNLETGESIQDPGGVSVYVASHSRRSSRRSPRVHRVGRRSACSSSGARRVRTRARRRRRSLPCWRQRWTKRRGSRSRAVHRSGAPDAPASRATCAWRWGTLACRTPCPCLHGRCRIRSRWCGHMPPGRWARSRRRLRSPRSRPREQPSVTPMFLRSCQQRAKTWHITTGEDLTLCSVDGCRRAALPPRADARLHDRVRDEDRVRLPILPAFACCEAGGGEGAGAFPGPCAENAGGGVAPDRTAAGDLALRGARVAAVRASRGRGYRSGR